MEVKCDGKPDRQLDPFWCKWLISNGGMGVRGGPLVYLDFAAQTEISRRVLGSNGILSSFERVSDSVATFFLLTHFNIAIFPCKKACVLVFDSGIWLQIIGVALFLGYPAHFTYIVDVALRTVLDLKS